MRIAFNVTGLAQFRLLGPVIDRALASGCDVECWYDHSRGRTGRKAYLFPAPEAAPRFRFGRPDVRTYRHPGEISEGLSASGADAVASIAPLSANRVAHRDGPVRVCVQSLLDTFLNHSLEGLNDFDVLALQTPWWFQWASDYFNRVSDSSDVVLHLKRLRERTSYVGFPELDARPLVDPEEVRHRWGIPREQPVVVLLPFSQGVGTTSFWPKNIFGEPSRPHRVWHMIRTGQFQYRRRVFTDPSDAQVVGAVRRFCDRNGAFLLVKAREKAPVPDYTSALADKCVYDETYYPPTILEVLSVASLCVSFYSAAVLEAAALSVPNLCITFSAEDYLGPQAGEGVYFRQFLTREEGGVFQFDGVSKTFSIEEAIEQLNVARLSDFRIDPQARDHYVDKFIGQEDGQASARMLDAIRAGVGSLAGAHRR